MLAKTTSKVTKIATLEKQSTKNGKAFVSDTKRSKDLKPLRLSFPDSPIPQCKDSELSSSVSELAQKHAGDVSSSIESDMQDKVATKTWFDDIIMNVIYPFQIVAKVASSLVKSILFVVKTIKQIAASIVLFGDDTFNKVCWIVSNTPKIIEYIQNWYLRFLHGFQGMIEYFPRLFRLALEWPMLAFNSVLMAMFFFEKEIFYKYFSSSQVFAFVWMLKVIIIVNSVFMVEHLSFYYTKIHLHQHVFKSDPNWQIVRINLSAIAVFYIYFLYDSYSVNEKLLIERTVHSFLKNICVLLPVGLLLLNSSFVACTHILPRISSLFKESTKEFIKIPAILICKSKQYILLEKIGNGGFSRIYKIKMKKRGRDNDDNIVAFKQFDILTHSIKEDEIKMIEKEIEMLSQLKHDNIVKIIGAIGNPEALDAYNKLMGIGIVMEYCENGSLRSLLNKNTNNDQQQQLLNMDLIIHLLCGAAQGLEYLHNHIPHAIMHGDIKSDNILIDKEYNAKLCDFGISKLMQTTMASTRIGNGGTLAYKAPETFDGKADLKSDVYSFGCVILELLTGERPWNELKNDVGAIVTKVLVMKEHHDISKVREDTRKELLHLMKRCLDYDKDNRPTMKQVRMQLEKMMNNAVLIELDGKSYEYKNVENLFFPGGDKEGSLNRDTYRIVKIDKVRHLFAERRYDAELSNIKSRLNGDVNERLLFHGTSQTDPMMILNHPDAFMKDHADEKGNYGRGLYFAELARYSNLGYRFDIEDTNQHQILVCSVICGNQKENGLKTNSLLTQKDLGTEYHSIHAGPHRPSEAGPGEDDSCMYVVYKDTQVLPKYLITYESGPRKNIFNIFS